MRDIILAAYLYRSYDTWLFMSPRMTRADFIHGFEGQWALDTFDRYWPTFWVAAHPMSEVA